MSDVSNQDSDPASSPRAGDLLVMPHSPGDPVPVGWTVEGDKMWRKADGTESDPASRPDVSEGGDRPRAADHLAAGRQWNSPLGPGIPPSETSDPASCPPDDPDLEYDPVTGYRRGDQLRGRAMAELPIACHYCRSTKYPMSWYVTREGVRIRLCDEGNACLRRKMRRDGIRLAYNQEEEK